MSDAARRVALAFAMLTALSSAAVAQSPIDPGAIYRVFLQNGQALPAYGESARVGDRVVFTLVVSPTADTPALELVSLPAAAVDLDRTFAYAIAVRAARYAATRGETDYLAITAEVERAVDRLLAIDDAAERRRLAEQARRRLVEWSRDNYRYRAADIDRLAALFDDVIEALGVDPETMSQHVELTFDAPPIPLEPLLAPPGEREALTLALAAAEISDVAAERTRLLRTTESHSARGETFVDLRDEARRRLDHEGAIDAAYEALSRDVIARADAAAARGDVEAVVALVAEVASGGVALGAGRGDDLAVLQSWVMDRAASARRHRAALDRYAAMRAQLLAYERVIRPVTSAFDGLRPILDAVRDRRFTSVGRTSAAKDRLDRLGADLAAVTPIPEVADVHATLTSSLHLAREACARAVVAAATATSGRADDASAAAAGALLLFEQARAALVQRLFPPRLRP
jgi:hypothetical protein